MGILDTLLATMSQGGGSVDPVALNSVAGDMESLGSNMSAASHVQFGIQARQAAQFQADQLRQNANTAQAASQRQAFDIDRQTQFITSRALAVAAASGGGASDPSVVRLIARDAGEGAYQRSLALYGGNDRARLDLESADARLYEGKTTERNSLEVGAAGYARGATNLLRSQARGASLLQRFGGDGPQVGSFSAAGGVGVGDPGWGSDITGGGS
jgi:hypothetical protein